MSDDLYQDAILQRAKAGAEPHRLTAPDATVTLDNPLCGDRVTIDLKMSGATIADIGHHVRGCALCQASAAVVASAVKGQSIEAARSGRAALQAMIAGDAPASPWAELEIFTPVRRHKSRQDCVRLPFDALERALSEARKA
jgi:nitrogen fixation NifU-like protein